jgi:hypothetical protein
MGEILSNKYRMIKRRCKECGKLEGEDNDLFLDALDELTGLTEEEEKAWEWFADTMGNKPFTEVFQIRGVYTREEMIHIFILANLIERLLTQEIRCESCCKGYGEGRALC